MGEFLNFVRDDPILACKYSATRNITTVNYILLKKYMTKIYYVLVFNSEQYFHKT